MDPKEIQLFYHPKERLRATAGDRSYVTVKPVWAAPLSRPGTHLSLLNGKGEEILLVRDPKELEPESLTAVERELRQRDLTAEVVRIRLAKQEFGATYWYVDTDRGPRDFVTQNLQENALWFSDNHLLLLDVDGNRFELPDIAAMDTRSQLFIHTIL